MEIIRTLAWLLPSALAVFMIVLRRPSRSLMTGLLLSVAWNAWAVLAVNVVAVSQDWWTFSSGSPSFVRVPAELWFGWVVLWGAVAPLIGLHRPVTVTLIGFLWFDLIVMPSLEPVVVLGGSWTFGEILALSFALFPGLLLFRWTHDRSNLYGRASLQVVCAGAVLLWLIPLIILEVRDGELGLLDLPAWHVSVVAQLLLLPLSLGARAAMEFAVRGRGTPLPYDPPQILVSSGPYSYVRNPMQLSMVLVFAMTALLLWNPWLLTAAAVTFAYGVGLARWHEDTELVERFGEEWMRYRSKVRAWLPTFRPRITGESTLFIAYSCGTCSSIGRWFRTRGPVGLQIAPAEDSGIRGIRRVTYMPTEGPPSVGVAAIARALEHIHLGWAVVGWILALPGFKQFAQVIADSFGPTPREVGMKSYDPRACDVHPRL